MKTKVVKITDVKKDASKLKDAAKLLVAGELVSFPTETVYGLGADAFNPEAVQKIFQAKNRPLNNPMIVHIADAKQLSKVASEVPICAKVLMKTFWPGPLSIVLPKHKKVPYDTTAGLNTVVVRFPKHPIAQALIKEAGIPIAAPSANLSGKVSPTRADHVIEDLEGRIPLIIDSGDIEYGLESTVVDCSVETPAILRPGSVTFELLKLVIPDIKRFSEEDAVKSPGTKYRHYSTNTPIRLFVGSNVKTAEAINKHTKNNPNSSFAVVWHAANNFDFSEDYRLSDKKDKAAHEIFNLLRTIDHTNIDEILIQGYADVELGNAIMNRLEKAASKIVHC